MNKLMVTILLVVMCIPSLSFCIYEPDSEWKISTGEGDWYFDLHLEPEYAAKYEHAYFYPEKKRLSLLYKQGAFKAGKKRAFPVTYDESQKGFIKEKTGIMVQAGSKPTEANVRVYGYYQQKDPLTDKELPTKHWVFKFKKSQQPE